MKYAWIDDNRECYPIARMFGALVVPRSGYLHWRTRPPSLGLGRMTFSIHTWLRCMRPIDAATRVCVSSVRCAGKPFALVMSASAEVYAPWACTARIAERIA